MLVRGRYALTLYIVAILCASSSSQVNQTHCEQAVQLVGGQDDSYGIVQIYIEGEWSDVCTGVLWYDLNAQVLCRQLGHPFDNATSLSDDNYLSFGYEIVCSGNETCLEECDIQDLTMFVCDAAGVRCTTTPMCTDGDIVLAGLNHPSEGRVEICYDGFWGTVCDDGWDVQNAVVVCRQLDFENFIARALLEYGFGVGDIWLDNVECVGNEDRLMDCQSLEISQHNCNHFEDAGVTCRSVVFLPYGAEIGDATTDGSHLSLGPLYVETPIVYYLRKEYYLHVTTSGNISFQPEPTIEPTMPQIVLQQLTSHPSGTLHARVARDESTLETIKDILTEDSEELTDFNPSVAVVMTWSYMPQGAIQAVLTTNGWVSFVTFIYTTEQMIQIFGHQDLLVCFRAGDTIRGSAEIETVYQTLSLRIDGHCITLPSSCNLKTYPVDCNMTEHVATACRCYQNDLSGLSSFSNATEMNSNAIEDIKECSISANISCIPGSVASPCIPPGALDTGYSGCYPTLLPCFFEENCLNESCSNSEFVSFGEGAGDVIFTPDNGGDLLDGASGPNFLTVPIVYLQREFERFHVSTNGLLSFEQPYDDHNPCGMPCTGIPIVAPIWADLDFRYVGRIYYRSSQEPDILQRVAEMITDVNPGLSDYNPTLAVIVTWFKAEQTRDVFEHIPSLGTIQLILSTDGNASFAAFLYTDPDVVFSILSGSDYDYSLEFLASIGFDGEIRARHAGANFGEAVLESGELNEINMFRIDGTCITSVLPGEVCGGLQAHAAICEGFAALNCSCDSGFKYNGTVCVDVDECFSGQLCNENSDCSNTIGSFECTCKPGYTGNDNLCNDIDECEQEICGSFSECFNTIGNYSCFCDPGYDLIGRNMCLVNGASSLTAPVVGSSVSAVVLMGIIVLVCCLVTRRRNKIKERKTLELRMEQDLLRSASGAATDNEYRNLSRMRVQSEFDLDISQAMLVNSCNLELGKTIGQGEFGIVYKALLKTRFNAAYSETVAVKTLKGFLQDDLVTDLLKECAKMKEFDHPNILPLRGVCLDGGPAPYIIMPFMTNGSLLGYLKENRSSLILDPSSTEVDEAVAGQKKLLDMCIQVAKGMEYLASKRLIHRDLAARNCMIDSGFVIKVADFGLSESMDTTKDYFRQDKDEAIKLPIKWLAPESISDTIFSEKTDVWSYGVTCWEVFSGGRTPYPAIHPLELLAQLENGYRLEKPKNAACSDEVYKVVADCWAREPKERPHFYDLVADLSAFLSSMAEYFDLGASDGVMFAPIAGVKETEDDKSVTQINTDSASTIVLENTLTTST